MPKSKEHGAQTFISLLILQYGLILYAKIWYTTYLQNLLQVVMLARLSTHDVCLHQNIVTVFFDLKQS
nr:MAG TPA: hypothetical protein [Caudoviricetes sp.]